MDIKIIELEQSDITQEEILTNFYAAETRSKSGWAGGESISHIEWCKKEIELFIKRGRNVGIVRNNQGQLALFEKGKK